MDPFIWPATLFGQKAGIATKKQQQHIYHFHKYPAQPLYCNHVP